MNNINIRYIFPNILVTRCLSKGGWMLLPCSVASPTSMISGICTRSFEPVSAAYASRFASANLQVNIPLLLTVTLAAIAGTYLGKRLLKKVTLCSIQLLVAVLLILISMAMGSGLICPASDLHSKQD